MCRLAGEAVAGIVAGRRDQNRRGAVNAEIVPRGKIDKILGVDRAIEVVVKIAALRHFAQEGKQKRRLLPDGFKMAGSTLLGVGGLLCGCAGQPPVRSDQQPDYPWHSDWLHRISP